MMVECKKYNPDEKNFSLKIYKQNPNTTHVHIEKRTKEQIQSEMLKASVADRLLKWLTTGDKVGLSQYTDSQLDEIKKEIEKFQHDIQRDEIDTENQLEVLAYIYTKLHFNTLYKNPKVLTGSWNNSVENNDIYGGLVENYTPCAGISETAELLCKLYGIDAEPISVNNAGVGHSITGIPLENGKYLLFDIADSIGMTCDGKYEGSFEQGDLRERSKYLFKKDIGITRFGLKHKPVIVDEKFKDVEPQIISENEKLDVFNRVAQKVNKHRIGDSKISVITPKSIKIQPSTSRESQHIKITPSSITQASFEVAQKNPGQLSAIFKKIKNFFSRIIDKFRRDR